MLIRVGGPNAGHKVYLEPKPFTFHHLPSGTLHSRADLVLGPGTVMNVESLMREIGECGVDFQRLSIDPQAMIISKEDIGQENGLAASIGSTGQGVGAATARKIMGRGNGETKLARDVPELKPYLRPALAVLDNAFRDGRKVLLEGTQGTGLSIHHGQYPYVTSRDTTVAGCLAEAGISPGRVRKIVMVCRTYPIRVQSPNNGTSGPISQEQQWKEISRRSGLPLEQILATEKTSTTKRDRRVGEFEWALLRKASSLNMPTDIALTFADYLGADNRNARRFDRLNADAIRFIEEVELVGGAPVSLISTDFHPLGIIDRRSW